MTRELPHGESGKGGQLIWSYASLAIAVALGVVGQISLKAGVLRLPSLAFSVPLLFNPLLLAGLLAYFFAALFYIYAIRQVPLSVAFPSVSISYVVVAFFAHWIWGESFGRTQILAMALISAGVYILGREA